MIHDYKFQPKTGKSHNKTRRRRSPFLIGTLAIATAVSFAYLSTPPTVEPLTEVVTIAKPQQTVSLALPAKPGSQPDGAIGTSMTTGDRTAEPLSLLSSAEIATNSGAPEGPDNESDAAGRVATQEREPDKLTEQDPVTADGPGLDTPQATLPAMSNADFRTHEIKSGESLASIFADTDLSPQLLHRIVNSSKEAEKLADIRPGQTLEFHFQDDGSLAKLILIRNRVDSIVVTANDDDFDTEIVSKAVDRRIAGAASVIESSLFVDGQKAGLTDSQIMELAAMFGWDIDFALEIRAGDQFKVLYEEQYLDGKKFRNGPILAAEFTNRGHVYTALRYTSNDGEVGYYDETGHSKRRAFIRTPIKFARVSSGFSRKRWHPVLKKWRSHKGVDYAAPTGTPIRATGAGKITFRGWKGGYGRVVIVQHGSKYQTLYAHMSKFSSRAKTGRKVKQGQIIGYVGKSGLATGPHLHYEFRVNGVHRNPLKVELPKSLKLAKSELPSFRRETADALAELRAVQSPTMVASVAAESSQTR